MQIYCPQCHVGYQFDDKLLASTSQKLKCSSCGCVFAVSEGVKVAEQLQEDDSESAFENLVSAMSEDVSLSVNEQESGEAVVLDIPESFETELQNDIPQEEPQKVDVSVEPTEEAKNEEQGNSLNETEEGQIEEDVQVDLEEIFERLSEHTENLIEREKKLPFYEKAWFNIKNALGFHFKISWVYLLCFCGVYGLITLYNNRFDVVRKVPFMNSVYKSFGIKARIPGEGLEFQNVNWEYFDDEAGRRFEIKGFVNNMTNHDVNLPVIHIEILDKETILLQSQNRKLDENKVDANTKLPLEFIISNPAPTAKYIYMTFIDND